MATEATCTEYPCKQIPGNVWYEFKAHGETIGHSGPPGLSLRLLDEETVTGRTLTIVNADGSPLLDEQGRQVGALAFTETGR